MPQLQPPPAHAIKHFPVARFIGGFLEKQPRPLITLGTYGLLSLLALIDYSLTPLHITVQLIYIVPIFIITWFVGPQQGVVTIILTVLINFSITLRYLNIFPNLWDPFLNDTIATGVYIMVARAVSVMRALIETEQTLARTDPMTGAANPRAFYELAERELSRAQRTNQPLSLAYLDLDNFKTVNDRWGHAIGDIALGIVVATIHNHIRVTDQLARLGGDEFILLLPETDTQATRLIVNRIQAKLLEAMQANHWPVTFSIGVVTFIQPPKTIEDALKQADEFMYAVKHTGKNRVEYHLIE